MPRAPAQGTPRASAEKIRGARRSCARRSALHPRTKPEKQSGKFEDFQPQPKPKPPRPEPGIKVDFEHLPAPWPRAVAGRKRADSNSSYRHSRNQASPRWRWLSARIPPSPAPKRGAGCRRWPVQFSQYDGCPSGRFAPDGFCFSTVNFCPPRGSWRCICPGSCRNLFCRICSTASLPDLCN